MTECKQQLTKRLQRDLKNGEKAFINSWPKIFCLWVLPNSIHG